MAQLFTPGLQLSSHMRVVKRRELPLRGQVIVQVGDSVTSDSIVATAERDGDLSVVRVAENLGVAPEDVSSYMKVALGDTVAKGGIVAEARSLWGLLRSTVQAPVSGTVEFISHSTGHVGIRGPAKTISIAAYIDGSVTAVEEGRAAVIESQATFVQGIFGVGGEQVGTIRMIPVPPDTKIAESHIPAGIAGAILVGGHSPTIEALRKAADEGAVGFVTGSIDDRTLCSYVGYDIGVALTGDEAVSMTLIVTEGFGEIAINPCIVTALKAIEGARASINGATQVRAGAVRPEIISRASAAPSGDEGVAGVSGLAPGSRVRLIRVPFFGAHGVIEELPHELVQIETGAFARVARVRLQHSGESVLVPRANLEAGS